MAQRLRVFVSSPGDVPAERLRAALVIDKLAQDYRRFFVLESYRWEHEPMLASGHFQDAIAPPSAHDIVLLILWSRLGTPLPAKTAVREYRGIDGRVPVTGTEWEYEDALRAARERGAPDILAFRNISHPAIDPLDPQARARSLAQLEALDAFWQRHFADRGVFLAAYDQYRTLEEFAQRLEQALCKLIERRIAALAHDQAQNEPIWTGAPFRGLEAYEFEHAPIFFGRDGLVAKAAEQLAAQARAGTAFLLVCGPSGSGKSSLVKAALVPRLMKPQRISGAAFLRRVVFRPGDHPDDVILGLAEALTRGAPAEGVGLPEMLGPGQDAHTLAAHLRATVDAPGYVFAGALGRVTQEERQRGRVLAFEEAKLILVVDQLEELFTLPGISVEDRHLLIRLLAGLARSSAVWVVATLRADFWHRAADMPDLMALAQGYGRLDIAAPAPAELAEIIRKPAQAAGLSFESHPETGLGLDAVLAERAAAEPGVLPLLSFTLDELYRRDITTGHGRALTYATYEAFGGLEGAIATRADETVADLLTAAQAALPRVLRTLATVATGTDHVAVARVALLDRFPPGSDARAVVDALTKARLLVASNEGTTPTVRFAHEALLSHWQRAKDQLTNDRRDLETRELVERQRVRWQQASGRAQRQLLLRDPDLANAVDLDQRWGGELDADTRQFIHVSQRRARRQQQMIVLVAVVFGLVALAAIYAQQQARVQRTRAESTLRGLYVEQGRQEWLQGNTMRAVAYLSEVYQMGKAGEPLRFLLKQAMRTLDAPRTIFKGRQDLMVFSPDGQRLATASRDQTARLWDTTTGRLLATLEGHQGSVSAVEFSPDGQRLATASRDQTARLWDTTTGRLLATLEGHQGSVSAVEFSPDGQRLATASGDQTARLWDTTTGRLLATLEGHQDSVSAVRFSPDGQRLATASRDQTARLWDTTTGRLLATLEGHQDSVSAVEFSPDGQRLATASGDQTARLWDTTTGRLLATLEGHQDSVSAVRFSPDGQRLTTASESRIVGGIGVVWQTTRLWDAITGRLLGTLEGSGVVFSPDGQRLVTTGSGERTAQSWTAWVWDTTTGRLLATLEGHQHSVRAVGFSPDGQRLATASQDQTARLWDITTGRLLATLEGHQGSVRAVGFSPDGQRLATASDDGTARLWDISRGRLATLVGYPMGFSPDGQRLATASKDGMARLWGTTTGRLLATLEGHQDSVMAVVFSPDGQRLATASNGGEARLWDTTTGRFLATLEGYEVVFSAANTMRGLPNMEFSPNGHRLATVSRNAAQLWDATTGRFLATLEGHKGPVEAVVFSPDGQRLATASRDKTVRLWDAITGRLLATLEGHQHSVSAVVFSPDGQRLATTTSERTARLWDAITGRLLATLEGHQGSVEAVVFSPDGQRLATASAGYVGDSRSDQTARLWDTATGRLLATLEGHQDSVSAVRFSPDGQRLATASMDKTVRLWDTATGRLLAILEGHKSFVWAVVFSPDGQRLATAGDEKVRLWDATTGYLLTTLEGHDELVTRVVFSPDGQRLATASGDQTTLLWDVSLETRTPETIATLVRCKGLWRLDEGRLLPANPDPTTCPPHAPAP